MAVKLMKPFPGHDDFGPTMPQETSELLEQSITSLEHDNSRKLPQHCEVDGDEECLQQRTEKTVSPVSVRRSRHKQPIMYVARLNKENALRQKIH